MAQYAGGRCYVKPRLGSVSVNRDPKKGGLDDLFRVMIQVTLLLIHVKIMIKTTDRTINTLLIASASFYPVILSNRFFKGLAEGFPDPLALEGFCAIPVYTKS